MRTLIISGAKIRRHRELRGKSIKTLAAEANVALGYLYKLEQGRHQPGIELTGRIAAVLDCEIKDLVQDEQAA